MPAVRVSKTIEDVPLSDRFWAGAVRASHKKTSLFNEILDGFEHGHAQSAQLMSSYSTGCVFEVCVITKFLRLGSDCNGLCGKPLHVPLSTGRICSHLIETGLFEYIETVLC